MTMAEPDDGNLRDKVARSVVWVVAERWGSRLLTLVVFAILGRLMPVDAFGLIALATSVTAVLQVFVDSGFAKALIQLKTLQAKDASTAFWTSVTISVVLYTGLFFSAPLLADLFNSPDLTDVLRVMGISLPIGALSQVPAAMLERTFQFKVLSVRQLIAAVAGALVAIPLALFGGGIWALVAQIVVGAIVGVIVLWATTPWRPKFEYSIDSLKRLGPTGVSIMGTELLDALQGNIDKLVIGFFFSQDVLGFYYLAQRIGMILIELVTSVISRVSLTTFSRVQHDLPRLNRIFRQMTFVAGAAGILPFTLVTVFAPQFITLVFGEKWLPAVPILLLLAPGWALGAIMYFDRTVLLATGNPKSAFWLAFLQNAVGVALVFLLLPLGILGVIISRWARVFTWPVRLWVLHKRIDLAVGPYLLQIGRCVGAALPVVIGIALLQMTPWAQTDHAAFTFALPMGIVSVFVYAGTLWLIAGDANRALIAPYAQKVRNKITRRRAA